MSASVVAGMDLFSLGVPRFSDYKLSSYAPGSPGICRILPLSATKMETPIGPYKPLGHRPCFKGSSEGSGSNPREGRESHTRLDSLRGGGLVLRFGEPERRASHSFKNPSGHSAYSSLPCDKGHMDLSDFQ